MSVILAVHSASASTQEHLLHSATCLNFFVIVIHHIIHLNDNNDNNIYWTLVAKG